MINKYELEYDEMFGEDLFIDAERYVRKQLNKLKIPDDILIDYDRKELSMYFISKEYDYNMMTINDMLLEFIEEMNEIIKKEYASKYLKYNELTDMVVLKYYYGRYTEHKHQSNKNYEAGVFCMYNIPILVDRILQIIGKRGEKKIDKRIEEAISNVSNYIERLENKKTQLRIPKDIDITFDEDELIIMMNRRNYKYMSKIRTHMKYLLEGINKITGKRYGKSKVFKYYGMYGLLYSYGDYIHFNKESEYEIGAKYIKLIKIIIALVINILTYDE